MTVRDPPSDIAGHDVVAPPLQVRLEGDGPFLLPFFGSAVSFGFGDDVAVMRMTTREGQEVLLPFSKETLRTIGLALADTLKVAFRDDPISLSHDAFVSDDIVFERRDET
jgi:hypothetical protein